MPDLSRRNESLAAVAAVEALTGGTTTVTLDQGFVAAMEQLKLRPAPVLAPTSPPTGRWWSLVFPTTGANVSVFDPGSVPNYVVGQVQHGASGFSLTYGGSEVPIGNLNVDPGVSAVYGDVRVDDEPALSSVAIFALNGNTLEPLKNEGDTAILQGSEVKASGTAAGLLNTPSRPTRSRQVCSSGPRPSRSTPPRRRHRCPAGRPVAGGHRLVRVHGPPDAGPRLR